MQIADQLVVDDVGHDDPAHRHAVEARGNNGGDARQLRRPIRDGLVEVGMPTRCTPLLSLLPKGIPAEHAQQRVLGRLWSSDFTPM